MKRQLSIRPAMEQQFRHAHTPGMDAAPEVAVNQRKGFAHLLENHQWDDIARFRAFDTHENRNIAAFLFDGVLPRHASETSDLAEWLLENREPAVFLALADLGKLVVRVRTANCAATLLGAVLSRDVVSGIDLIVSLPHPNAAISPLFSLVANTFLVNNGVNALTLCGKNLRRLFLAPLVEALGGVADLRLSFHDEEINPDDLAVLGEIVSRSTRLKAFHYVETLPGFSASGRAAFDAAMLLLLKRLTGQARLESLTIKAPYACHAALANVMANCHALAELHIMVDGPVVGKALTNGLQESAALEKLTLEIHDIEDGMLPLIAMLAQNRCCARRVSLITLHARIDLEDSDCIKEMIGANTTITDFSWRFGDWNSVDLTAIAEGIEKNRSLQTVKLCCVGKGHDDLAKTAMAWRGSTGMSRLLASLSRNWTLTEFDLYESATPTGPAFAVPEIAALMRRNLAHQRYACTAEFVEGAASGFFRTFDGPADLGLVLGKFLLEQQAALKAGSLMLVNKATCHWALYRRRAESIRLTKEVLTTAKNREARAAEHMVSLLKRIAVTRQDFSNAELRAIAASPLMPFAIYELMFNGTSDHDSLRSHFSEATGEDIVGYMINSESWRRKALSALAKFPGKFHF